MHKSASSLSLKAACISSAGRDSPKLMMESLRTPWQSGISHRREVAWLNTPLASLHTCTHMFIFSHTSLFCKFLPSLKVSQVLPFALLAGLQISVAVKFGQVAPLQTTAAMEAVYVLRYSALDHTFLVKLYQSHVSERWQSINDRGHRGTLWTLFLLSHQLPNTWPSLQHRVHTTSIVRDTTAIKPTNTCTCQELM